MWRFPVSNSTQTGQQMWKLGVEAFYALIVTPTIFTKLMLTPQLFVKSSHTKFYENKKKSLVADASKTDGWADMASI
jgi:hypothetical protein